MDSRDQTKPTRGGATAPNGSFRALRAGQPGDDIRVGRVDGLLELTRGDGPAEVEGVPPVPADVGHHPCVARIALEPLVGRVAIAPALEADRGTGPVGRAVEREDLAADLGDQVALPWFVLPGARL